jgi:hypothetical protein
MMPPCVQWLEWAKWNAKKLRKKHTQKDANKCEPLEDANIIKTLDSHPKEN